MIKAGKILPEHKTRSEMKTKRIPIFLVLMCCALAVPSRQTRATETEWFFVVIETHVHPKNVDIDDQHPEERRWYISNIAALPDSIPSYSAPKKVNQYFDQNVVSPAEKRGVVIEYNDDESQINGGSVLAVETRQQAEEMRRKDVEDRKGQGGNIYSFNVVFGPAKGEETSQPGLVYRHKQQPNYESPKKP
jgi:hypothetical protein